MLTTLLKPSTGTARVLGLDVVQDDAPVATISSPLQVSRLALRRHLHRRGWPVHPALPALRHAP